MKISRENMVRLQAAVGLLVIFGAFLRCWQLQKRSELMRFTFTTVRHVSKRWK